MKIVFLALLLLNLGLLGWHVWVTPAPEAAASVKQAAAPQRAILPRAESVTAEAISAQPGEPVAAGAVCAEFGPFADQSGATAVATGIRQSGATLEIAPRKVSVIDSYRVYFPSYSSAADAQDMGARLRRAGVKDVYIIPGGDQRNAVSVGVFKDRDGAERRRRHLDDLGFEPQVEALQRHDENHYWIRAHAAPAADLLRQAAAESAGERRIVSCGRIAAAAANP